MTNDMKLTFKLTEEQSGPFPVSTESLWFVEENSGYRLKNIPFFIDELSFDDVISVKQLDKNLYCIEKILQPSLNSTIWVYLKDVDSGKEIIDKIVGMACGIESGVIDDYYAVNVPGEVEYSSVYNLLVEEESNGVLMADYPSTRHFD